jgi:hypothetical protein
LGIKPKAAGFDHPLDVSFISGYFWFTNPQHDEFCFSPRFGRQAAKLFWTVKPVSPRQTPAYALGVVKGMLPLIGFLEPFRRMVGFERLDLKNASYMQDALPYWTRFAAPKHNMVFGSEEQFCFRYGITPDEYEQLLDEIDGDLEPRLIDSEILRRIYYHDIAELEERVAFATTGRGGKKILKPS